MESQLWDGSGSSANACILRVRGNNDQVKLLKSSLQYAREFRDSDERVTILHLEDIPCC